MKKLLALLLALVLLCSCLVACTPAETTPTGESTEASQTSTESTEATEATVDKTDYTQKLENDSILLELPRYTSDLTNFNWSVEIMGDGAEMLVIKKVQNGDGYAQYQEDLEAAGFTLYTENEIGDNHFATWITDDLHVTTMYTPGNQNVRIVAEPASLSCLPGLESDNVYTDAGVEDAAIMIGVDYDGATNNGMCFAYRLCDGSFILVDGGFNQQACADAIYETLQALAPDPDNIVIAAWIITHAHSDHTGGFYKFAASYSQDVTLEKVIYNMPTTIVFERDDTSVTHLTNLPKHIAMFGSDVEFYEAHPGQKYYIRDAVIEMLYTWEINPSAPAYISFFNESSLVFSIDLGGEHIMQLGDCAPDATSVLEDIYGAEILASDIMQTAHHGYVGASPELNEMIGAPVVLWPSTDYKFPIFKADERNQPLYERPYIYMADQRVTVVPLPFDPDNVQIWTIDQYTPRQ